MVNDKSCYRGESKAAINGTQKAERKTARCTFPGRHRRFLTVQGPSNYIYNLIDHTPLATPCAECLGPGAAAPLS